jgi:integrase
LAFDTIDEAAERATQALAGNHDLIVRLRRVGRERALMYKTLVLTGLRKGELASLTTGQLELEGRVPYAVLDPADEKNRKGSNIPLRADLAAELSSRMTERLEETRQDARRGGRPIPARLPASTPLFNVPSGLARILDRDLVAAGIPKRRVLDVHALRVTFGTHLCAAGVPLRTAQAAMRHSKPELTANIYTDPKLLDVVGAINALPPLVVPADAKELDVAVGT